MTNITDAQKQIYEAIFGTNWKNIFTGPVVTEEEEARYKREVEKQELNKARRLKEQQMMNDRFKQEWKNNRQNQTPAEDIFGSYTDTAPTPVNNDPVVVTKDYLEERMTKQEATPDISIYSDKYNAFDISVSYTKSGKSDDYSALLISLPVIGRDKKDVKIKQIGQDKINVKSVWTVKDPYPVDGGHEPVIASNNSSRFQTADHNSSDDLKSRFNFDFDITVDDVYDLSTLTAHLDQGLMYIFIDVKDKYEPGYFDIS